MEDTFQQNKSYLSGLPEGRIIIVTYYSQNAPITDVQSTPVELTTKTKDDVHISWTEIRNFEIRLSGEFNYEFQDTEVTSKFTGEGLVLPGFIPRIGDLFLYQVRNQKIGIFTVSNIARLALGQETYHRINFTMEQYLDADMRDRLRRQSTVWYFDKTKFLVGNNAFISTQGWIQQKELKHIRKEVIVNYMDRFYDKEFSSFMRPDGIFDPYVVEYWNKKISISDCRLRPIQLLAAIQSFHKTIWSALTMNPIKNLKNVEKEYSTDTLVSTFWGVNITSLLGHRFLTIKGEPSHHMGNAYIGKDGKDLVAPSSSMLPQFHGNQFEGIIKEHAEKAWAISRHAFYGACDPHRQGTPHCHVGEHLDDCNPHECHVCSAHDLHGHPPYPIMSDKELYEVWKKMHYRCHDPYHTYNRNEEAAKFRGYVLWYRENHPGTLSRYELERDWRKKMHLPPNGKLNEKEQLNLKEHIQHYRSHFLTVWNDRQIEWMWREKENISPSCELTSEQIHHCKETIHEYRKNHGQVPEEDRTSLPPIGTPYDHPETIPPASLHPRHDHRQSHGAHVPDVFIPSHKEPSHGCHHHDDPNCHICSNDTGSSSSSAGDVPTYVLSNAFYSGSLAMDPFEYLLYRVLTNQEFQVSDILDAVSTYLDWDDEVAFYRHLLGLYLIDKALYWLRFHS